MTTGSYGASPVHRRYWRTNAELAEVDDAIVTAVAEDHPVSLRGVYCRVVSAGAVPKTEAAYAMVGRQLLKLRPVRAGVLPGYHRRHPVDHEATTWTDLDEMLDDAGASYRRALWNDQRVEVHVFTEKDAISGVSCSSG